jgi:hypothetical protein
MGEHPVERLLARISGTTEDGGGRHPHSMPKE